QVFERDGALGAVRNRGEMPREEAADRLVDPGQVTGIERDPDQRGEYALGDRLDGVFVIGRGAVLIFLVQQIAVAHDEQAVEVRVCFVQVRAQPGERVRIDAVIGGRGGLPALGRPIVTHGRRARRRVWARRVHQYVLLRRIGP